MGSDTEYFKYGKEWVWAFVAKRGSCQLKTLLEGSGLVENELDMDEWAEAQKVMMRYISDAQNEGTIATMKEHDGAMRLLLTEQGKRVWENR